MPRTALFAALAASSFLAACGGGNGPDSRDQLPTVLGCLRDEKRLPVRQVGDDRIDIGTRARPYIRFFLTGGEAEAAQFEGREEGTEKIGAALLYVRTAGDAELAKIEDCLDNT